MDPQMTLDEIIAHMKNRATTKAYEACEDLHDWLSKRGFAPKLPKWVYIAVGNGTDVAFVILSNPWGGGMFIRYDIEKNTRASYLLAQPE